jgi:hypothetical protein
MKPSFSDGDIAWYVISTHVPDQGKGNYVDTTLPHHTSYSINAKSGQYSTLFLAFLDNYFEQIIDLGYDWVRRSETKLD